MGYIAHIRESDGAIQTVQTHLEEVSKLSERFGGKIGVKHLAGLAGLLHDLGKNSEAFKDYIQEAVANPNHPPQRGSVDHSTAGGKLIYQQFHAGARSALEQLTAEWISMCILSHHGGLRDFISPDLSSPYLERVKQKEIPEFEHAIATFFQQQMGPAELESYFNQAVREAETIIKYRQQHKLKPITFSFIQKYIFSCLIDADRTNTRTFEENEEQAERSLDSASFFRECYTALMETIVSFREGKDSEHPIHRLRSEMSDQCEQFASKPSGIYTLSIPTGGGKTLASLRYALKHAIEYGKDRIIYIVPYTTIIEQNAEQIRKILKNDLNIIEHHSNVIEEHEDGSGDEAYDLKKKKLKLAKDNWESQIIFTTMVQFLNVFYSRGTRNVRRLHNLANSVLIFDEVQSVPVKCISLFNEALNFLSSFGRSSIVLCTATQPALDYVENKLKIPTNSEMVQDLKRVSESFKRVNIVDKTTTEGYNASELKKFILTEMEKVDSLLVILNTKTAVRKLYEELNDKAERKQHSYKLFHLSTSMCPAHRKKVLENVKRQLETDGQRVICISTQLIEAGVDISFQCVMRSLAGLDSIAQAAGRCNRHGKDKIRNVYVIKSSDEELSKLKEIRIGAEKTARILEEFARRPEVFGNDLLSPEAMKKYFEYYYHDIEGELDYWIPNIRQNAFDLLDLNKDYSSGLQRKSGMNVRLVSKQSFATVEKYFQVIDQPTTSVLVPYNDEAKEIIADLNGELDSGQLTSLLRRAQQYVINLYTHELKQLDQAQNIDVLLHGNVYALKEVAYTDEMGLDLKGEGVWSPEII
ncbi:CRISPR-associated helicase Cas3' [Paenibacillus sp. 32O-W]|uniref:CRISPR-associated helicase Cas3' n=1 Tax=Paenibacillus sp. 32O-W TaxID=1695218 RepID=UPI0011A7438A|nr:CRISPR-associated helicase Cas3' [Paenibacillus sp. 32O-W]